MEISKDVSKGGKFRCKLNLDEAVYGTDTKFSPRGAPREGFRKFAPAAKAEGGTVLLKRYFQVGYVIVIRRANLATHPRRRYPLYNFDMRNIGTRYILKHVHYRTAVVEVLI
eukprot:SAG31_NODE_5330_length_2605_cov_6.843176_2_plen_112_part_00